MSGEKWGNRVTGRCPACGSDGSLFVAYGGYITCRLDVCSNPTAVADLLLPPPPSPTTCSHTCCIAPHDPDHQHLFEPSECPDCRALEDDATQGD